ncbi:MAG: protein-L-isoaspartate(D-aspartate) O-methyltransferase [Candidatus Omnitrophota bacterium]|nr:protein-L-isoaspartate(D-aspartate) O-methyltransferase [Candidatus Omnitrophota bacterium]
MEHLNFDTMRERMVQEQLIPRGISDKRVLEAFRRVPRHRFVEEKYAESAYSDFPLSIGNSQTISQPYMAALMTELLKVDKSGKILEIGTGSGYQLAILCELAEEAYSVERVEELAGRSGAVLKELGYANFNIKTGDGTLGWEECAPYDSIVVTAGAPGIPENLLNQLNEGGRLVIPIGGSFGQTLTVIEKSGGAFKTTEVCGCVFVPLIGHDGWAA